MSEQRKEDIQTTDASVRVQMFRMYCEGKTTKQIAEVFDTTSDAVRSISKREKWKLKKQELIRRGMEQYGEEIKEIMLKATHILKSEISKIGEKIVTGQMLDKDERKFVSEIFDKISKERRLEEGKPTENTQTAGVVEHRIVLPPGAVRFGVLPPLNGTILVEDNKKDNKDQDILDIDEEGINDL